MPAHIRFRMRKVLRAPRPACKAGPCGNLRVSSQQCWRHALSHACAYSLSNAQGAVSTEACIYSRTFRNVHVSSQQWGLDLSCRCVDMLVKCICCWPGQSAGLSAGTGSMNVTHCPYGFDLTLCPLWDSCAPAWWSTIRLSYMAKVFGGMFAL